VDSDDRLATAADTPLLGDRYRLGALLGQGGAGRVHEAIDTKLGRPVAVKVFQPGGTAIGRHRFVAEARMLAGLTHPGLVTVYDVSLDGDEPFLVMQLVDGPSLRDLLDRGPLDPTTVARIGARLAEVLAHVHARDIVHRDIKPANVLLDESGDSHLTDFGIARALGAAHLTGTGEFVGTAAYLAPEQITHVDVGPAADVYALGLVLLECLTGRTEYTGTTIETAIARLNRPPRVPESLPSPWHTLLTAMTAQDPADRPDARRCAELLSATGQDTGPRIPLPREPVDDDPPVAAGQRPPRLPRARPVHAGLSALALAAACAVAATTTTAIPGHPVSEPQDRTPATESVTEAAPPPPSPTATPTATSPGVVPAEHTAAAVPADDRQGNTQGDEKDRPGKGKGKNKGKG
jgi:serine/threonine protein kinase